MLLVSMRWLEKNFDQCQIEMNFSFIFCIVMYYAVNYLYFNLLISSILIQEAIVIRFH